MSGMCYRLGGRVSFFHGYLDVFSWISFFAGDFQILIRGTLPWTRATARGRLADQLEPPEIFLGPTSLVLDHALQSFSGEGPTFAMKCDAYSATVRVKVNLVRTGAAVPDEAVADQRRNDLPGRQVTQQGVIQPHESYVHRHMGFDRDLHFATGAFGNRLSMGQHTLHH